MDKAEVIWTRVATDLLVGRRIVRARYMTDSEKEELGWNSSPMILQLDDGNMIYASSDNEGYGAGALFNNDDDYPVMPAI